MASSEEALRQAAFEHLVLSVCGILLADRFGARVEDVIHGVEQSAEGLVTMRRGHVVDADDLVRAREQFQRAVMEAAGGLRAVVGGLLLQAELASTGEPLSPLGGVGGKLGLDVPGSRPWSGS